jgi:ligand-binding sensor domain-containing protein
MRFNDGQMRGAFADGRAESRGRLVLALLVWLGLSLTGVAQARHFHIQHYTELEGVPGSTVYAAAQDSQGCLWLAMRTGVARYDGLEWRIDGVEQGLPVAPQGDLAVDHRGRVWALALAMPVRVSHRERDGWRTLPMPRPNRAGDTVALALGRDPAGRVLAAVISSDGGIDIWQGETWHSLRITDPDSRPVAMAWQGEVLHLATMDGLYTVQDVHAEPRLTRDPRVPSGPVYAVLASESDDTVRLAGQGWLGDLGPEGFAVTEHQPALRLHHLQHGVAAALDHIGGLYVGDTHTVFYHHPDLGLESLGKDEGLVSNGVSGLMVDRGGHVWFANLRGLSKLVSRRFTSFDQSDGLLDDEVSAVLQRRDGTMVLGHEGGLTIMEPARRQISLTDRANRWLRATDLEEAADGVLWAALGNGGLIRLDSHGDLRHIEAAELLMTAIYAV